MSCLLLLFVDEHLGVPSPGRGICLRDECGHTVWWYGAWARLRERDYFSWLVRLWISDHVKAACSLSRLDAFGESSSGSLRCVADVACLVGAEVRGLVGEDEWALCGRAEHLAIVGQIVKCE